MRNLRDGKGLYVFKGGARYEGAWRCGKKHGKGKFTYPDGSIYDGTFQFRVSSIDWLIDWLIVYNEVSQNQSINRWMTVLASGSIFAGSWVNDKRFGYGVYCYQNGDTYLGQWKDGERSGYGYYVFKDSQAKHVGFWENGRRQGRGEILFGAYKFSGLFQNDTVIVVLTISFIIIAVGIHFSFAKKSLYVLAGWTGQIHFSRRLGATRPFYSLPRRKFRKISNFIPFITIQYSLKFLLQYILALIWLIFFSQNDF